MSFTAQFTKMNDLKILDENDTKIDSFNIIANETNWSEKKPSIPTFIVYRFLKRKIVIDLKETEPINSYNDLKRMGFLIISQRPKTFWFKRQQVFFRLCPINLVPVDCTVYDSIPRQVFIRCSYTSSPKLIRLEDKDMGRYNLGSSRHKNYMTGKRGFGDWFIVKENE